MATDSPLIHDGAQTTASVDLSGSQFYFVKLVGARSLGLANTGGEITYGVVQNQPTAGQAVDVGLIGISKVAAGAAFAAGAVLMTDTTGRAITRTSANHAVGTALEAATAAGQLITCLIGINSGDTVA